jgi:hypothetical protein
MLLTGQHAACHVFIDPRHLPSVFGLARSWIVMAADSRRKIKERRVEED